jgi:hypothetical protein
MKNALPMKTSDVASYDLFLLDWNIVILYCDRCLLTRRESTPPGALTVLCSTTGKITS